MKKMIAMLLALCLALAGASALAEESDLLDTILARSELVVGTEGTYAPNSYHDENGLLTGFDVEVARKIGEKLGVTVRFVEAEWDSLFAAMDAGRVDTVINEVEYTPERALKYDFSAPYTYIRGALLVAAGNESITAFADLAGKRSAQNLTSSWGKLAEDSGATVVSVDTLSQCIDLLTTGRADCTLNAETAFTAYLASHPDAPVRIAAWTEATTSSVVPLPKDNPRLTEAVNTALAQLRESGELAALSEQFFGADVTSAQ